MNQLEITVKGLDTFHKIINDLELLVDSIPEYQQFEAHPILNRVKRNLRKLIKIDKIK